MSEVRSRWLRWGIPLALAVIAIWFVSQRGGKKKVEAPLPRPILADGPPAFRQSKTEANLSPQYFDSVWPAGHRDSSNTDFVPLELGDSFELEKHFLQGHPIFWPPTVGLDGTSYVVTGAPPGNSHLFAISADGEVLWSAKPQESLDDLDSFAIMNAPTIDAEGDLYVGDRDQLWAFKPNGDVKWVVDLKQYGVDWGFMTVVLSRQRFIGGVTTDGKVLFFWSHNGELAVPPLDLPGGAGPAISHDGSAVYAVDELGRMIAIDAQTGKRLWQSAEGGGGSASPSIGADETIYTPFQDRITAYSKDGEVRWEKSYDEMCKKRLPEPGGVWSYVLSEPVAFVDSILTVGIQRGWMNVVCGYHLPKFLSRSDRTRVPVPQESLFVSFDLRTGEPTAEPLLLPETSEGFVTPLPNGKVMITTSGAITSIFYYMVNRILPERLQVAGPPKAGLLLLKPR